MRVGLYPRLCGQKLPQWDDAIQIQRINMPKLFEKTIPESWERWLAEF